MSLENVSIVPLKDVVKRVKVGFVGSCNNDYCSSDEGVPMIRTTNLTTEGIKLENLKYINNTFHIAHKKSQLHFGDILIARHGHNGLASLWEYKFDAQCLNVVVVEPDESLANRYYLTYLINSPLIQKQIKSLTGGSVQSVINTKDIADLLIPIPSLDKQKEIADFISLFNKKISVCKSINKNLEQLIKYIYINWFEEFEPFKDKDFYDTKLGSIPVGWDVKPLQEFIKFQEGPGIRNWQYVEEDGINFLNIRCIQNNDLVLDTANMISKEEANGKYAHFMLNEWDLVISSSGTLGRYAIVREEHLPLCLNTSIIRFTPMHSFDHYAYVYSYLTSRGFYHYLLTMGSGSVQLNFGPTHLKQIDLIVPPENILKKYNDLIFPLIEQMVTIKSEISKLTKLRDTLLPKLMSGEIDVSKINCDLKIIIRKIYIKSSKLFLWRYLSENKNYIKNTKSNETLLKSRTIYKINKFLAKFNARYRYYRQ